MRASSCPTPPPVVSAVPERTSVRVDRGPAAHDSAAEVPAVGDSTELESLESIESSLEDRGVLGASSVITE